MRKIVLLTGIASAAAAFAGVSAGFGANLIPATANDVLIGVNTLQFAQELGVPTVSRLGAPLSAPTMDYFYLAAVCVLFTVLGGFVTNRFVAPRIERLPWRIPRVPAAMVAAVRPESTPFPPASASTIFTRRSST